MCIRDSKNGELNYGATVKIKTPSGEGSGIVIGENLVLTVSHNFIKDVPDGNNRKVVDNDNGDGDIYSISYPGLPDVKFSKKDIIDVYKRQALWRIKETRTILLRSNIWIL